MSFWPVDKIITYSNESKWFQIGNLSKTMLVGNGIDTASIPFRQVSPSWPADNLFLIGVAISTWHGWDQ